MTDLCGSAYTDAMRHDEGITSFRCVAPQRPCLADGPVHVAVSTPRFATEWFSSAALEPPLAEGNCTAHADCDDGDACTTDSCAEGCCHHTPTADCLTDAEGYKAPLPMLHYLARGQTGLTRPLTREEGVPSAAATRDDYPPEYVEMEASMPFFDRRVDTIGISPNGAVNMGPAFSCVGPVYGSCQPDALFSVVALFYADLNPTQAPGGSGSIFYAPRTVAQSMGGEPGEAFVVQYEDVPPYCTENCAAIGALRGTVELHMGGRIVMHFDATPEQVVLSGRTFLRSGARLGGMPTALSVELGDVDAGTTVSLCPVPKVVCLSPSCGPATGGSVVTIRGSFFDVDCLGLGQPAEAALHCHFGASVVVATVVSPTELRCVTPAVETAGVARFQLSFGVLTEDLGLYEPEFLSTNGLRVEGNDTSPLDNTFAFTDGAADCGCDEAVGAAALECDVCGVCGGSEDCIGCDGLYLSNNKTDACGVCGGDESSCTGCDGVLFSGTVRDICEVCGGNNASLDCLGNCGGTAAIDGCGLCAGGESGLTPNGTMDCAGVCDGPSTVDECGTCDADPANDCVQDCNDVWGGTAAVDGCGICAGGDTGHVAESSRDCEGTCSPRQGTYTGVFQDPPVYLHAAVEDDCGTCTGGGTGRFWNAEQDDCGVCSGPGSGHVADSDKDCAGVCFGSAVVDDCGVCAGLNALLDCDGVCGGSNTPNECGQCGVDPARPCVQDCNGDWACFEDTEWCDERQAAFEDSCGTCVGGLTGLAEHIYRDCAGVCFAPAAQPPPANAREDSCGVCSGGSSGHEAESDKDCAGVCFGPSTLDECGVCDANVANDCVQDCNGVWGGTAFEDSCEVCVGGNTGYINCLDAGVCDCNGDCQGHAFEDGCGVCVAGNTGLVPESVRDCAGECHGLHIIDHCDQCVLLADACPRDCAGVWGGDAAIDECGRCAGGHLIASHNLVPNMDQDCAGVCHGYAFLDACGQCSGPGTPVVPNSQRDDCNVCSGKGTDHVWNSDMDCAGSCFGSASVDDCGVCAGGSTRKLPNERMDCDGVCHESVEHAALVDCSGFLSMEGFGPVIVTSAGSLCGLTLIICILVIRSRLRENRQELELRQRAMANNAARRQQRQEAHQRHTDLVLESLPTHVYDGAKDAFDNDTCSICLGEFEDGESLRKLPCDHSFHADCIASWLNHRHTCPLCVEPIEAGAGGGVTARGPRRQAPSSGGRGRRTATPPRGSTPPAAEGGGAAGARPGSGGRAAWGEGP